jgi:hypothetical protein
MLISHNSQSLGVDLVAAANPIPSYVFSYLL